MSFSPTPTSGDDTIQGDAQPDTIDALEGNDKVRGGGGDDELRGGPGNDALYGEEGSDRLLGGVGDDRYEVDHNDTVTELPNEGNDSVYFRDETFTGIYYLPENVENLTMIGRFNNVLASGNGEANRIFGNNTGNDILWGQSGNDYIQGDFAYIVGSNSFSGNTGSDLIYGGSGNDVIWGDQGPGKELVYTLADDTLFGDFGDDVLYGQAGADQLDGGLGNDLLYGGADNDVLDGGFDFLPPGKEADLFGRDYFPGNDTLVGGAGDDTYLFGRSSRSDRIVDTALSGETNQLLFEVGVIAADVAVRREGNDLNFYIVGFADNKLSVVDYFISPQRPVTQAAFSDGTVWDVSVFESAQLGPVGNGGFFIRGTNASETLTGTGGNDTIDGMDGADKISGGDGNDYLLGGAGGDQLRGGSGNDLLNGGSDRDILVGGAGADTLLGDVGDDFLDGGAGNDVLDGGPGKNTLVFQPGDGQDTVRSVASSGLIDRNDIQMASSYAEGFPNVSLVLMSSTTATLTRVNDDLVIGVNGTTDSISIEKYFLSAADNLYPIHSIQFSDVGLDNAAINARVQTAPDLPPGGTNGATSGNDVLTGTGGDDVIYGQAGNDFISGLAGNDFLNGELGNDLMAGGTGNDTLVVDSVLDVITERPGEGNDTVQSYISYELGGNVENLILIGDIATRGTGNELENFLVGNVRDNVLQGRAGNDVLYGNAGNDFLNGELGNDQMFGGLGNDTVIVDSAGDYVWEAPGEGDDTVQSYISYTLQDNFENLVLIGEFGVTAAGNSLANLIEGNERDNLIDGKGGLDTLTGNGGNDRFVIYTGQEQVAGGTGTDTLQFDASLTYLSLQGVAGTGFTDIEAISMQNGVGNASTVWLTLDQVLSLSSQSNSLRVDGDAGDTLQIQNGWTQVASLEVGYSQYTNTVGAQTGVLLVGQETAVVVGDWL